MEQDVKVSYRLFLDGFRLLNRHTTLYRSRGVWYRESIFYWDNHKLLLKYGRFEEE